MKNKTKPRPRLSRESWLETAFKLLYKGGIKSVSIDALATELDITRGSFYHHFENRGDLHSEMISFWKQTWTMEIRDTIAALGLDGRQSLIALENLIKHRQAAEYDVAMRDWAVHDKRVMKAVAETDKIRLDFIRSQFAKLGFEGLDLENRSRLFLYNAMIAPSFMDPPDEKIAAELDRARFQYLTTK